MPGHSFGSMDGRLPLLADFQAGNVPSCGNDVSPMVMTDSTICFSAQRPNPSCHSTGKERDAETGLDYFRARYYSAAQGRFTSPDPLLNSGRPDNPKSWNRYAYALNNPLRYIDPSGLYDWDESAGGELSDYTLILMSIYDSDRHKRHWASMAYKFRMNFRAALRAALAAAFQSRDPRAIAAVCAYGEENDGNGVLVGVTSGGHGGGSYLNNDGTITVKIGEKISGNFEAVTVAHEGDHVAKLNYWIWWGKGSEGDLDRAERERGAYTVGGIVAQELGMKSFAPHDFGGNFQIWNSSWKAVDIETFRSRGVANLLNNLKATKSDAWMREKYSDIYPNPK
jgi:RHS repeat-associated protein